MKLPKRLATLLAELHDKAMEVQEEFNDYQSYECDDNDDELYHELTEIIDQLDTIESETSELDCEYNDYD